MKKGVRDFFDFLLFLDFLIDFFDFFLDFFLDFFNKVYVIFFSAFPRSASWENCDVFYRKNSEKKPSVFFKRILASWQHV